MAVPIFIKRGSRAAIDAAAAASGLKAGEPYLITDENRLAVGLSVSAYEAFAKQSEAGGATVPDQTQGTWDAGTDTTESKISPAKLKASIATHGGDKYTRPTSSTLPVGAYGLLRKTNSGTLGNGSTIAGSNLRLAIYITASSQWTSDGASQTGTWRLISGYGLQQNDIGYFVRES